MITSTMIVTMNKTIIETMMGEDYNKFFNDEPTFRSEEENDQESEARDEEEQAIYERDDKLGAI